MPRINFTKAVASGNDFVVIESGHKSPACPAGRQVISHKSLARKICDRKYGIGADGLLVLEKSKIADFKMRIFNSDGSEAEMCGNGARCAALYSARAQRKISIETKAGVVQSHLKGDNVKIKLTNPANIKLDILLKVNKRNLKVNFIDTGVPHAVIFVEGINEIHVSEIGRAIRNHKEFYPRGTNVDFVEVLRDDLVAIRTYERGVEDETLACGTGTVAAALIFALKTNSTNKINVLTKSRETLRVYFKRIDNKFTDVWLEGKAKIICKGEYF